MLVFETGDSLNPRTKNLVFYLQEKDKPPSQGTPIIPKFSELALKFYPNPGAYIFFNRSKRPLENLIESCTMHVEKIFSTDWYQAKATLIWQGLFP